MRNLAPWRHSSGDIAELGPTGREFPMNLATSSKNRPDDGSAYRISGRSPGIRPTTAAPLVASGVLRHGNCSIRPAGAAVSFYLVRVGRFWYLLQRSRGCGGFVSLRLFCSRTALVAAVSFGFLSRLASVLAVLAGVEKSGGEKSGREKSTVHNEGQNILEKRHAQESKVKS